MWQHIDPIWKEAARLAWDAYCSGTIPIGAVVVNASGDIVARGQNSIYSANHDHPLSGTGMAHAEVSAMCGLKDRDHPHIRQYKLYTTMEPCPMCFSTMVIMGIRNVEFAARDGYGGGTSLNAMLPYFSSKNITISHSGANHNLEEFFLCLQTVHELNRLEGRVNKVIDIFREDAPRAVALAQMLYQTAAFDKARDSNDGVDQVYQMVIEGLQVVI